MENHNSFMDHQQMYAATTYPNAMPYLPTSEDVSADDQFEKLHGNRDGNFFLSPEAKAPYADDDGNQKFGNDNLPFPLQCFPNESSSCVVNSQQSLMDDVELLPDLPSKDAAPDLESSAYDDKNDSGEQPFAGVGNHHKTVSDMPDLSADYYENGNSDEGETNSDVANVGDVEMEKDDDEDGHKSVNAVVDDDDEDVANHAEIEDEVDANDEMECDDVVEEDNDDDAVKSDDNACAVEDDPRSGDEDVVGSEVMTVLDSCLDVVEVVDATCSSVPDVDKDSFPSVVLPRSGARKTRRKKMNWNCGRQRLAYKRSKSQVAKEKVALLQAATQQPILKNILEGVPHDSPYVHNSSMTSVSDTSHSGANYNLVGVAEYSMLGPDRILPNTSGDNIVIKEERALSPNTSIDNMSTFQNESDEYERDSAFVIKELVATLNNILLGNTNVHKYSDADYDRFEVVNHETGTFVTIMSNCANNDNNLQSARRVLGGMRYLQNGPHGRGPNDSSLKQCFVKLNRIGHEDDNSEEAISAFSTPALENEEATPLLTSLTETVMDEPRHPMRKKKCEICHYVFTEKHFEQHVCRYCPVCEKVFANVSGFRKHQRYYCPALKRNQEAVAQEVVLTTSSPEKTSKAEETSVGVGRNLVSCEKCGHAFAKASIGRHRCTFCLICHSTSGRCKHIKPQDTPPAPAGKGGKSANGPAKSTEKRKGTIAIVSNKADAASTRSSRSEENVDIEGGVDDDLDVGEEADSSYQVLSSQSSPPPPPERKKRKGGRGVFCPHCNKRCPNNLFMRRHQMKDRCFMKGNKNPASAAEAAYSSSEEKLPQRREIETRAKVKKEDNSQNRRQEKDEDYSPEGHFSRHSLAASSSKRPRFYMDSDSDDGGGGGSDLLASRSGWKNKERRRLPSPMRAEERQERRILPPSLHGEERPQEKFSCSYCYMIFSSFIQYKSHIQMHIDENSHECPYCLERFANQYALKDHVRIHIQGSRIICRECGERFPSQKLYFKHMLQKH